jgi:hypothetical protein
VSPDEGRGHQGRGGGLNGTVDVVYYGTNVTSKADPGAVWHVYLAQSTDAGATFVQTQVSPHPNHAGPICTQGIACAAGTRNLPDLFEVAIDGRTARPRSSTPTTR